MWTETVGSRASRRRRKNTRRPLGAAHHVDAGGHHVRGLAAAGQLLGQRHLVEVEGRVQAALAHLQLVAQRVDGLPGCTEGRQEKGEVDSSVLVCLSCEVLCNISRA